ncbi:MAG: MOSC domain-containing protein, partial [Salinirussus sp.]
LEIGGVPPFWEDKLFGDAGEVIAVDIGDVTLEGLHPCARCVVPARNPDTGAETPNFRQRFIEHRRDTRPSWTAGDRYDHDFRAMVTARVPDPAVGRTVAVDDPVRIRGSRKAQ